MEDLIEMLKHESLPDRAVEALEKIANELEYMNDLKFYGECSQEDFPKSKEDAWNKRFPWGKDR